VLPSISAALLPKIAGKIPGHSTAPKTSISRATKKTVSPTGKTATGVTRKPTLTKKGQGSFSVLGTPTSKVKLKTNETLFEFI